MFSPIKNRAWSRRQFIATAGLAGLANPLWPAQAEDTVTLPFENGERPLVKYPQKRPLIRLTTRPTQLETPFSVFNESLITPNDAFFVRYHLSLNAPNALLQESVRAFHRTWYRDLVTALPEVTGGYITVPEGPGLGLELAPDIEKRFTANVRTSRLE